MSELLQDRKCEILQEILDRLLQGAPLNMLELVDEISVSRKTLYNYFSNRQELLEQVAEYYFDNLERIIADIVTSGLPFSERGNKLFSVLPGAVRDIEILSKLRIKRSGVLNNFIFQSYSSLKAQITSYVQEGQSIGAIKIDIAPDRVADLFFTLIKGNLSMENDAMGGSGEQRFSDFTKIIILGILAESERRNFTF